MRPSLNARSCILHSATRVRRMVQRQWMMVVRHWNWNSVAGANSRVRADCICSNSAASWGATHNWPLAAAVVTVVDGFLGESINLSFSPTRVTAL